VLHIFIRNWCNVLTVFKKVCFSKEWVFFCFLLFGDWIQAHCYIVILLQIKESSIRLCVFLLKVSFGMCNLKF